MTSRNYWLKTILLTLVVVGLANGFHSFASRRDNDNERLVSTSTPEGRLAVFDDVWETIDQRYYDPSFRGIDWDLSRTEFRPLAARADSTREFYDVLRRMIAPLKDAHTRVYSPDEKFDWWKPTFVNVGLSIRNVEGRITVIQVEPKSPAQRAGIKPGDVLEKVDGVPSDRLLAQRLQLLGNETDEGTRFRVLTTLLEGSAGSTVTVTWQNQIGSLKKTTLQRQRIERVLGFHISRQEKWIVVKLDTFTPTVASELERQLSHEIGKARGLILDLRSNGGGDADAMADIASLFLPSGINLGKFSDRSGVAFELHTTSRSLSTATPRPQINLSLVVLTSDSTSSAAEILSSALQDNHRAELLGNQTCGCVLAIRNRHTLPDGGVLDVSELDYKTGNGVRLEGVGVKPDQVVKVERRDLYSRRDTALEQAKLVLKNLVQK